MEKTRFQLNIDLIGGAYQSCVQHSFYFKPVLRLHLQTAQTAQPDTPMPRTNRNRLRETVQLVFRRPVGDTGHLTVRHLRD